MASAPRKASIESTVTQSRALDTTDRELLALLQANARESVTTLGKKLGVARTTVIARMERLQKRQQIAIRCVKRWALRDR
jgi:predicted ArsR family transcriptional regulator